MQFFEAAKKAGLFGKHYAAITSIVLKDEAQFAIDLHELKARMLDWKSTRGRSAKDVVITLVGDRSGNEWSKNMMLDAFANDAELSHFARECTVQVSILNNGKTAADQFTISDSTSE